MALPHFAHPPVSFRSTRYSLKRDGWLLNRKALRVIPTGFTAKSVTEFPPRPPFELPSFLPQLPRIFGLGDAVNRWLVAAAGLADAAAAAADESLGPVAPGLSDLDLEYLRAMAAAEGRPLVMVPPDVLPDAWRRLD